MAYGERPLSLEQPDLTRAATSIVNVDDPSSFVCFMSGIAPRGVTRVRAIIGAAEQTVDVEPVTGAFLVRTDDPYPPIQLVALEAP